MGKNKHNKHIDIKGARLHNLKNIDVKIPRNRFTVITGVSGSGKSTLAFDTIYAEGQRRFVESISTYARQFLERMSKPDCDSITGIPPAIAIEQKPPTKNPRSTVGTNTEIYDYLRILFGRVGTTICKSCGETVQKDSPASVIDDMKNFNDGDKVYITFNMPRTGATPKEIIEKYKKEGYFRIVQAGSDKIINIEENEKLELDKEIYILVDRVKFKSGKDNISRLTDSVETAFSAGEGKILIMNLTQGKNFKYSSQFECADCEIEYFEPEPKLFSFNNPYGACPVCQGFGRTIGIDEDLVFPDKSLSIKQNAIHPFKGEGHAKHLRALMKIAPDYDIPVDKPIISLNKEQMKIIMDGANGYTGVNGFFKMLENKNYKLHYRVMLSRYRGYTTCHACGGSRIRTSGRQVYIGAQNLPDIIQMPLGKLREYFEKLKLSRHQLDISSQVLEEIKHRIGLLVDIGLEYLTLSRLTHTLSGGESQRINLASALGSSLVGTLYVLDEPSIGMHPRDTDRLLKILFKLRNIGNTIIVVEHDPDIIKNADRIIDIGPKAGENGGEIIFEGDLDALLKDTKSITGKYLSGKKEFDIPKERNKGTGEKIEIINPRQHNLRLEKVSFPTGCINVVTGVSGSGKSTLVHDILYAGLKKYRGGFVGKTGSFEKITGAERFDHIELVDQSPIGKSSRSTPATYTKAFDAIRELYSQTQLSRQLGWKPGHFSFNVPGGRCEVCEGEGIIKVDMQFLPDVHLECEACKGTRYKKEVRNLTYEGKSIVDVLNMTIDEAAGFFKSKTKIVKKLSILQDVGLGYLRLGQPSTMLSGGESQRVKLANHLDASKTSETLFIFDEPSTGLHIDDISKLISCFRQLIEKGHTVIIIEHNLQIIAASDYINDLGPEAGENGGLLIAQGTPEELIKAKNSYTAKALKDFFDSIH